MDDEEVALAFAADVESAVAEVRDLAENARMLAGAAKEAQDGVAGIAEPAAAAGGAIKEVASASAEADGALGKSAEAARGAAAGYGELADAAKGAAGAQSETALASDAAAAKSAKAGGMWAGMGAKVKMALLGIAIAAGLAVNAAGKYQDTSTHLVTDAGESAKNLAMVQQGMLAVSAATGTSSAEIVNGMYHVESAGYHGAQGLAVLKIAAEGAKVGGADLDTVSKSLTGTLNAYGMTSTNAGKQTGYATTMMNELIATVGAGDMRMQDLASSLGNVAPVAASAKVSFSDVGGALATMTGQNMSAQQATQDLRHTILALESPNKVAQKEMANLGLSASDLSSNLGKRGLAATLQMVTEAAHAHAGAMGQTYTQAMYKAMGGTTGLTTALMLTGSRMSAFRGNAATVTDAARKGGDAVANWSTIQGTFAFKTAQAKASVEAAGISLGMVLLPAVSAILGPLAHFLSVIAGNKTASIAFAVVVGGILAGALGVKLAGAFKDVKAGVEGFAGGIEWLLTKLGILTVAQEAQTVATEGATVAQADLDVAMSANPIGLIIIAVVALIAVIVLLATHWRTVWHAVSAVALEAWHFIDGDMIHPLMHGIDVLVHWIESHWRLLAVILATVLLGPVAGLIAFIATHWAAFRRITSQVIDDVTGFFERLPGRILHAIEALPGMLYRAGTQVVHSLVSGAESMIGGALSTVEGWGHDLANAMMHPFGIHFSEPSDAVQMIKAGRNTIMSYVAGVRAAAPEAKSALAEAIGGPGGSAFAAGGGYGGSPSVHVSVPVTVQGGAGAGYESPQFQQYLQGAVQEAVLRYAQMNPGNGFTPMWGH